MIAGLILAGGRSSRFGSDKACARLHGRTLLELAKLALQGRCAMLAASARPGSEAEAMAYDLGLEAIEDQSQDSPGPLAGIRAGLVWAEEMGADRLAVRAVDAPFIPGAVLDQLQAALGRAPAAYCVSEAGPEPLCSLWTLDALPALEAALEHERHPAVHHLLDEMGAARLMVGDAAAFANINTPQEMKLAEARELPRP